MLWIGFALGVVVANFAFLFWLGLGMIQKKEAAREEGAKDAPS
jgi:threonine/homoserine/homoserine lactone efflux protein